MTDIKDIDLETVTKKKKRQRASTVSRNEDHSSRLQYEECYAEGYVKKLYQKLDENSFNDVLSILERFENDSSNLKEHYAKMECILKDHEDLLLEFLGFLEPYQALECRKLMLYYEICSMKQFIRNLLSHFKRQPHLMKKIIDKLCYLSEHESVQQDMVEEAIAPFLQKNSILMQQFLKLLPGERLPDWYFSSDDMWEDFCIDNEVTDEETFDISPNFNDPGTTESSNCIYDCKKNTSVLCPICNIKFINGRTYVTNGKMLRPANIVFNHPDQMENVRRLCKNDYFSSVSLKSRNQKRLETNSKEANEGRISPFTLGTESEEEQGESEPCRRKRIRKNPQRLKIRFKSVKKKGHNPTELIQLDDTAPSNDEVSCDDTGREDNDYYSCDDSLPICSISECNSVIKNKEVIQLEDMELNISATSILPTSRSSSSETHKQPKNPRLNII